MSPADKSTIGLGTVVSREEFIRLARAAGFRTISLAAVWPRHKPHDVWVLS